MTEEEQVDAAVLIMRRFRELTLGNITKDRQIKYLLMQLGGYVMPTQMNGIVDRLNKIEEGVSNAELETD